MRHDKPFQGTWVSPHLRASEFTPRLRASEIPAALERDRHIRRAEQCFLVQLTRDWHNRPEEREWLLSGEPPAGCDLYDLAKVAAVIRGLCERDDYPIPAWIVGVRAPSEIVMLLNIPLEEFDSQMKEDCPSACAVHGVYYEADFLVPKDELIARAARAMGRVPRCSVR